ncbi:MAG: hypothetical protein U0790_19750 [Isosphaeraceae bacterium]
MSLDPRRHPPETWQDPEFAPFPGPGHPREAKGAPGDRAGHPAEAAARRVYTRRISVLWIGLAVLFVLFLYDRVIGSMIVLTLTGIALSLAVLAGAMALGMVGTGLFAIGDRLFAWLKRSSQWPEH